MVDEGWLMKGWLMVDEGVMKGMTEGIADYDKGWLSICEEFVVGSTALQS